MIEEKIKINILNEKELLAAGKPTNSPSLLYGTKVRKFSKLDANDVIKNLKSAISLTQTNNNSKEVKGIINSETWLNLAYVTGRVSDGLSIHEEISRFRQLWTAFNALYKAVITGVGDKNSVREFAKKEYVKDYFENLQKYDPLLLKIFVDAGFSPESNDLAAAISNKDKSCIALHTLLCIYEARNSLMHGDAEEREFNLSAAAFKILNPLVKIGIAEELKKLNL